MEFPTKYSRISAITGIAKTGCHTLVSVDLLNLVKKTVAAAAVAVIHQVIQDAAHLHHAAHRAVLVTHVQNVLTAHCLNGVCGLKAACPLTNA